jgi:two-component system cell cycle response regulator
MPHTAYLLIGDPDPEKALTRAEFLTAKGYRCIQASDAHSLIGLAGSRSPDLVLLGAFGPPVDGIAIAQALKGADVTENIPVVLLDQDVGAAALDAARDAAIDDVLGPEDGPEELAARLPRLTRGAIMTQELDRRLSTAASFGVSVDPRAFKRSYPDKPEIMAVARDGDDLKNLTAALGGDDLRCVPEVSPFRAADRLDGGRFDAAVLSVSSDEDLSGAQYLCAHIRNNPRLFNLPTLILLNGAASDDEVALYRGGAAIVLRGEANPARLKTYLHMLVARQRLRWTLRDPFKATLDTGTADSSKAAYSHEFWTRHADATVLQAAERGANLAIGYLNVPTLGRVRQEYGEDHAEILAHQLADWVTGMTRIEDTVARVADDALAVLLPGTPEADANRVIQRIVGILHSSEFHLGEDVMRVIHAWVEGGVASLRDGDTADSLFARARDAAL